MSVNKTNHIKTPLIIAAISCETREPENFFSGLKFDNCIGCVYNCYDQSCIAFFTISRYITNLQCDQLPVGLMAQLVERCTSITEIMGSNPILA